MSQLLIRTPLFAPVDGPNSGVMPAMDSTDIFNFLNEDSGKEDEADVIDLDTKKDAKKDDTKKEEDDDIEVKDDNKEEVKDEKDEGTEEEDELAELEQELEGPTDEQLELMPAPRRKEILKAYPDLFKKFPYLEKAYYRDQQFTEVTPTIADAKEAVTKAAEFDKLNAKLESGDIKDVLTSIHKKDKETFNRLVDNYLPLLNEIDPGAYLHIVSNVTKHITMHMFKEAERTENKELKAAAVIMHQAAFGTSEFTAPTNLGKPQTEDKTKEDDITRREREFNQRRFTEAQSDLSTKVGNSIKATIDKHIDPKGSMTDYVKRAAIKDALENVNQFMSKDTRFKSILDKLWEDSYRRGFDRPSLDKIRMACISKAQTLLPTVIKSARNEALKGLGKRAVKDDDTDSKDDKKAPTDRERPAPDRKTAKSDASKIPAGMTTAEYMMQDD